jgi:hypothetical protein
MPIAAKDTALAFLRRHPQAKDAALTALNRANLLLVDYPVRPEPRYGWGKPAHGELARIIGDRRGHYRELLRAFGTHAAELAQIEHAASNPAEPVWQSRFTSGLDAVAIYCFICERQPALYVEVGSGNSTKFARRAIRDHGLTTRIVSIDPHPRAEVDAVCDEVVRRPLEHVDLALFDRLGPGDVLYIDNSHRAFMNSDVTVAFVDILPRLRPGVLVGFDDIYLPNDYPPEWRYRYYSEQYLLATFLLAGGDRMSIELPCAFVTQDPALRLIARENLPAPIPSSGTSFWLQTTAS